MQDKPYSNQFISYGDNHNNFKRNNISQVDLHYKFVPIFSCCAQMEGTTHTQPVVGWPLALLDYCLSPSTIPRVLAQVYFRLALLFNCCKWLYRIRYRNCTQSPHAIARSSHCSGQSRSIRSYPVYFYTHDDFPQNIGITSGFDNVLLVDSCHIR